MLLFSFTIQTAAWIIMSYVALCLLAYWIQERFIFKPEKLSSDFEYKYNTPFKELHFSMSDGAHINGLLFYTAVKPKRGLLMYFHGNTRSVKGWSKYARDFSRYGYDVLMIDYRGYGKSFGKRTETNLKKDAEHIYHRMRFDHRYAENQIVVYGRSLGSGFATKLASVTRCKMLILDAPYYSFSQLTNRFLPFLPVSIILRFKIRTDQWIKYVRCPVYIIHGTKDRLIPLSSSIRLAKIAPLNTHLVSIQGGGHNDLPSFEEYHRILGDILTDRFGSLEQQIMGDIGFNA